MRDVQVTPVIAAACAGFAAWISLGSLAVATASTGSRFGFLPPLWLVPVLMVACALGAWAFRITRSAALPLFFSLILVLPWIPGRIPPAFLLWTGPVVSGVWGAVILGIVVVKRGRDGFWTPLQHTIVAAAMAFGGYVGAGWHLSAILPVGDEPHYLIITQSLLRDGDIRIENNYAENQNRDYFPAPLRPHYGAPGVTGARYSVHAPGVSVAIAPAFALFGYPGVVVFLALVAALGSALLWHTSYQLTGEASGAWFGWASGALTVPFFFRGFAVYPDGLAATLALFAAVPLVESRVSNKRWIAIGAALAAMPWLHARFAIISATLASVLLLRLIGSSESRARIVPLLLVPVMSAIAWFAFFRILYGTFDPSTPYGGDVQTTAANILTGLPALLFDQQFGALPNAPVYAFCFAGLFALARRRPRLATELVAVVLPYVLVVATFRDWWGGASGPVRYLTPVLPLLALPGAHLWSSTSHLSTRAAGIAALSMSVVTSFVLVAVDGGRLALNIQGYGSAADWISPLVDVSAGMPSFFRNGAGPAFARAVIWIGCMGSAVVVLRVLERKGATPSGLALATPASFAVAVMCALTVVWGLDNVAAVDPEKSQVRMLAQFDSRQRPQGVTLQPLALASAAGLLPKITIATPTRPGAVPPAGTLLLAPHVVPGGMYELRVAGEAIDSGTAKLVIGRLARTSKTWDLGSDFRNGRAVLELPVDVGSLMISGDRHAAARALTLHPTQIWEGPSRLTGDFARRVERYGPALVSFFDVSAVFHEDSGFWLRGGRDMQMAVGRPDNGASLQMFVRNAAAENQVQVEIDGVEHSLSLRPREERTLPVPIVRRPGALIRIHSQSGFRPSAVDARSSDTRFLGVWIEFR
jgi:hypothetical protein